MDDEKGYYIVSLKKKHRVCLTFWEYSCAGYTTDISKAGIYDQNTINDNKHRMNNGKDSIAIPCEDFIKIICPDGNPFIKEN